MTNTIQPSALVCACHVYSERIRSLLTAAGFLLLPTIDIGSAMHFFQRDERLPDLCIASVQEGGLALAEILQQTETKSAVSVMLFDQADDVVAARSALRFRVTDYLRASQSDDALIERMRCFFTTIQPVTAFDHNKVSSISSISSNFSSNFSSNLSSNLSSNNNFQWDASLAAIYSDGNWLKLSPVEWRLFESLLQHRGETVTTLELITGGLGRTEETPTTASLLRLHMSRLRSKISGHVTHGVNIVTMRSRGYMLV